MRAHKSGSNLADVPLWMLFFAYDAGQAVGAILFVFVMELLV